MKYILIAVFLGLVIYISFPSPKFPEPADTETPLRRGYYTNATRQEVIEHYQSEFKGYRLNYPPEEAQTIIRDQTKSTFLEEIVHPLRESIYINGFEPTDPQYAIVIKGTPWRQKVIVRYVRSNLLARLLVVALSGVAAVLLIKQWAKKS